MSYLDRPQPRKGLPWAHNSLGASVHNALAGWWRLPRRERSVAAAGDLLDQGWLTDGYADDVQSAQHRARARQMVQDYVTGLDPADEPAGVERTVATRTDLIAVSGRIDRLDLRRTGSREDAGEFADDASELVVVDYKTGRYLLTVDDTRTSMPLALYALAAGRVLRRLCRRVELHHLPTGRVLAWVHTQESLDRQLRRAEDIAAECAAADEQYRSGLPAARYDEAFPPRPGMGCGWCDYRSHCPEGMAAAESRRPWDGLAPIGPVPAGSVSAGPALAEPVPDEPVRAEPAPAPAEPGPGGTAL
jgi:RecB family exonuclease